MANENIPTGSGLSSNLLPDFYQTPANKKFLQATIDQLFQPGSLRKVSGFIGRQSAKAATGEDIYVEAVDSSRTNYQLEPGLVIKDSLDNVTFFKDYNDYINQLNVFGGNTLNHARLNSQEFYSWNPHIDWDKFINFQNYYWLPYGPMPVTVYGQQRNIESTYTVELQSVGNTNEYLFTPNGLDLNPTLKLYRGQTYKFNINSPANPFSIKVARIDGASQRYTPNGIDKQAVEVGTITFTIPDDAPSILFYQSEADINVGGAIEIFDIEEASIIDVEKDILGKLSYKLADGTALSNGMKIKFGGNVTPAVYQNNFYYVEGVGTGIKLVDESTLEIVSPYTTVKSIEFDTKPFDTEPFSDTTGFASVKDYIVINRASGDHNAWTRYNRWFHKDVINASAAHNNTTVSIDQTTRAKRPIIEFEAGLRLFNMGQNAIADINLVDTYTSSAFSTIEGAMGYNIDGVDLVEGHRIIFLADQDPIVKNKVFKVTFINITGVKQIHLEEQETPVEGNAVLVLNGNTYQSQMFWYHNLTWVNAQQKTKVNQPPLFDLVDNNGISFGDSDVYKGTTFAGTQLFGYKINPSGIADTELGFALSYQNVANVGDIVFNFDLVTGKFEYKNGNNVTTANTSSGFLVGQTYGGVTEYVNGWTTCKVSNVQAAVRIYKNSNQTNNFNIDIFDDVNNLDDLSLKVFVNGYRLDPSTWSVVTTINYKQVVLNTAITANDILIIKAYAAQPINENGYYEIPLNLQNNPLNDAMADFTLGEVTDHVGTMVENVSGFSGIFPGESNLRDLGDLSAYGTRFVQHSGPMSLSLYHITSESNNIIKAIESSRDDYGTFKRAFIQVAETLGVDTDPVRQVDAVLRKLNENKPNTAPYYFSDMVPYGASISTNLNVVDYRVKTYPLTNVFSLDKLSNKAVGVYHISGTTKTQLVYGQDYTFNVQGFIVINNTVALSTGDIINTVEYDNTDACFVPATPTKLGMWPAFVPQKYLDTTLINPQNVIQGHDGSIILAYNDYRDDLLLELEKRIFNNIKVQYDPTVFDINEVIPGFARPTDYSLEEFNSVLSSSFYKWVGLVGIDFTKPLNYDRANSFTYNYSNDIFPDGNPALGYWRGIYRYLLDTDRPQLCPWEMLGYTQQPTWWTSVYGPAPYTKNNLILWNDLANGYIREPGKPLVKVDKYARPVLEKYIPVDENGNLLSPLASGFAQGVFTQDTNNNFVFGDVSPVENAWRRSSYYPFSVLITALLLKPAKCFGVLLDRSRISRNIAGQLIYTETGLHIRPQDVVLPSIHSSTTRVQTAGIINYIVDYLLNYIFSSNVASYNSYLNNLKKLNVNLTYRVGAFTSKEQFNLLLESKTPFATGNVFVPQEDISIFLNTSSPINKLVYSGIIVTRLSTGFEIKGYSKTQPYFKYYDYIQSGLTVNVGGISENYSNWAPNQQYVSGSIVKYGTVFYRATITVTSGITFDSKNFVKLDTLPISGGVNATFRSAFDKSGVKTLPYGTVLLTVQDVVDVLLGHGAYLKDQGFRFDAFNKNLNAVLNWETSAKEFMFWTTQNWSAGQSRWTDWQPGSEYTYGSVVKWNGDYYNAVVNVPATNAFDESFWSKLNGLSYEGNSVITLSPAATGISFDTKFAVVDAISNPFNDYEFCNVDGTPILPSAIDSYREGTVVTYTTNNDSSIYSASFYFVQTEHVVSINNTDIFNDVIYNLPSGYRRERLKLSGYITTNWYGGLDIPGFLYDRAIINAWQPYTDYNLGDIVQYQSYFYSANAFIPGAINFDSAAWTKLSAKPKAGIMANWTNIATQFTDFYSLDVDSFDNAQQSLAQHLIGYQKRQYLNNIIQDDVSEFKFYQGMIREKGTQNVLNKLFNVLGLENRETLTFYEEWAVRTGQYGASKGFENIEFELDQAQFRNNPQGFVLTHRFDTTINPFIIQQTYNDVYVKPLGYNNNPFPELLETNNLLRSAGYVNPLDINETVYSIEDFTTLDLSKLDNGSYIWAVFDNTSWNVYKYIDLQLKVVSMSYESTNKTIKLTFENIFPLSVGDYIGISNNATIQGAYKITGKVLNTISVTVTSDLSSASGTILGAESTIIYGFVPRRTDSIDNLNSLSAINSVTDGDLLWTDNNDQWKVWKYTTAYNYTAIDDSEAIANELFGTSVSLSNDAKILVATTEADSIITFDKVGTSVPWERRSTLGKPFISNPNLADPTKNNSNKQVGTVSALSSDGTWLAVGSPTVSYVATNYVGSFSIGVPYSKNSIVVYNSVYYRALQDVPAGTVPGTAAAFWELIVYIPVETTGTNSSYVKQGAITLYKKDSNNNFSFVDTIVSPVPASNELFGASLAFGDSSLYIGAPGFQNNTGKVYKLSFASTELVSAIYNPVGSLLSTVALSSTTGIFAGMFVNGVGITSGQQVAFVLTRVTFTSYSSSVNSLYSVYNLTVGMAVTGTGILSGSVIIKIGTDLNNRNYIIVGSSRDLVTSFNSVILNNDPNLTFNVYSVTPTNSIQMNGVPDSTPTGALTFSIQSWGYDFTSAYVGDSVDLLYGSAITVSEDNSTLAISAYSNTYVYKNSTVIPVIGNKSALSMDGTYIATSNSLYSSNNLANEGQILVFKYDPVYGYSIEQVIENVLPENNGQFGDKIYFMNDAQTLVIYSRNGDTQSQTTFDNNTTTFDLESTRFVTTQVNNGRVDIYDRYNTTWVFSESLKTNNVPTDGYGTSIAVGANTVVVGAPYTNSTGELYSYIKPYNKLSWNTHEQKTSVPDVRKIKQAFLYNKKTNQFITYLDVIDPLQGKIAGPAEEEIKFKTFYDPAYYASSTNTGVALNANAFWGEEQVGQLWWDLRTAKFIENNLTDVAYRNSHWNMLATGASIDVYEWVSSGLIPSEWDAIADTTTGLSKGVTGKSLYGDSAYNVVETYDHYSQTFSSRYYYWVKNRKIIPNVSGRNLAANDVASLITNPRTSGYKCLALTGTDSFSLINVGSYLNEKDIVLSIEYWTIEKEDQNIHSQWKIISNDPIVTLPSKIEQKWVDSLCGIDLGGRLVPDPGLPQKLRYGIENRPRQGMFVNRIEAIKQLVERVNRILLDSQVTQYADMSLLESFDPAPTELTGLYDASVDLVSDLSLTIIGSYNKPVLTPVIVDGRITDVTIVSGGKGYRIAPYIIVSGSGSGAVVKSIINNTTGTITGVTVLQPGEGYDSNTTCSVRDYSVLVKSDSTAQDAWSIYSYDSAGKVWSRAKTQAYDVRKYWETVDWYATGYSQFSAPDYYIETLADFSSVSLQTAEGIASGLNPAIGSLVKVNSFSAGNWVLLEKYSNSTSLDWTQSYKVVGIQKGTIQFKSSLYNFSGTAVGYDSNIFDNYEFDVEASTELRIILQSLKKDILIDSLKQSYLDLFFASVRYVMSEQLYVDWIFKTSFVRATHIVGKLDQPVNYPIDNLDNFQDYVAEVKPYRTKIREYISNYSGLDTANSSVSDFDLPPVFENNAITTIDTRVQDGQLVVADANATIYPWKLWADNVGFEVTDIKIVDGGSGYVLAPVVTISAPPNGVQATAKALVSNGVLNNIIITNKGSGYLEAPVITVNGGLQIGGVSATLVAIIGNGLPRSIISTIKFDRIDTNYYFNTLNAVDTRYGTGSSVQFKLTWAPDVTIGTSSVTINNVPVLRELYNLQIIKSTSAGYTQYTGLINFDTPPANGSTIVINYKKDVSILSEADRIQFFYNPTDGQLGKDLSQLLKGIDYGGTVVSGLGFNIGSGWGVAPYYTEKWDNRNPSYTDYVVQVAAGTSVFVLPKMPPNGTNINVYHKQSKTFSYSGNASTQTFAYDPSLDDLSVTVTTVVQTVDVTASYVADNGYDGSGNALHSAGFTLYVTATSGIVPGMGVYGQGFLSKQKIVKVIGNINGSLRLSLDSIPDNLVYRRTYTSTGSFNTTLEVSSTEKLIVGMKVSTISTSTYAQKFTSNQVVTKIINKYTIVISSPPDIVLTNGEILVFSSVPTAGSTLKFTNIAGSKVLTLNSISGLQLGNVVTNTVVTAPNLIAGVTYTIQSIGTTDFTIVGAVRNQVGVSFTAVSTGTGTGTASTAASLNFNTVITAIDPTSNSVTLDQILLLNIPANTQITFIETLNELTDMTLTNGVLTTNAIYPVGSTVNITGLYPSVRLDDPNYGTVQQSNANAIMTTPIVGTTLLPDSVIDGGSATVVVTVVDDGGTATDVANTVIDGVIIDQNISNVIQVPATYTVYDGDEFILRYSTSDGSIPPTDDEYDTSITGGDFTYSTATGIAVDDIIVDGSGFNTVQSSHAPEEVVPGQVVDTLAIKVYEQASSGSAAIKVSNYISNGTTATYKIGQRPNSPGAVIVKLGANILTIGVDYTVNYSASTITFTSIPTSGQTISIYSIGFNGTGVLDLNYFVADGATKEFITKAKWTGTVTGLVYVDGVASNVTFFDTDMNYVQTGVVGIRFGTAPVAGALINFIIVNGSQQSFAITKHEVVAVDGTSVTYPLTYKIGNALPNETNMIVRVGQSILRAPNNVYFTIGKKQLNYTIDPSRATPSSVSATDVYVYAGGNLLDRNKDYVMDPTGVTIKITNTVRDAYVGQKLVVSIVTNSDYSFDPIANAITFKTVPVGSPVEVISSYVHDVLDVQRTTYKFNTAYTVTPGTVQFYTYNNIPGGIIKLDRPVLSSDYVWVVKNTTLLTPSIDYKLNDDYQSITIGSSLSVSDSITITTFGSNILTGSSISYMQFKDMLNRTTYQRLNLNKQTTLVNDLHAGDTTIVVANASNFDIPNIGLNKPGVIEIRGERIEYFTISGNTLGQLRRGTLGTGINSLIKSGTVVQFIGASEVIPYADDVVTQTITSLGTNLVTLNFIPTAITITDPLDSTQTIQVPGNIEVFVGGYGEEAWKSGINYVVGARVYVGYYSYACTVAHTSSSDFASDLSNWEFFVANIRLSKIPYTAFNINNAPYSPAGDQSFSADYSLVLDSNGNPTNQISLTNAPAFGTRITVVRRNLTLWDGDPNPANSSTNINIINDTSAIANFIKDQPGVWYQPMVRYTNDISVANFGNNNTLG